MSKITHKEVLLYIEGLKTPTIKRVFLREYVAQQEKQEELLNKIKEIIDRQDDSYISSMLEESQRYYEIKELMNKEKENEKRNE